MCHEATGILGKSYGQKEVGAVQKAGLEILGKGPQPTAAKSQVSRSVFNKFPSNSQASISTRPHPAGDLHHQQG